MREACASPSICLYSISTDWIYFRHDELLSYLQLEKALNATLNNHNLRVHKQSDSCLYFLINWRVRWKKGVAYNFCYLQILGQACILFQRVAQLQTMRPTRNIKIELEHFNHNDNKMCLIHYISHSQLVNYYCPLPPPCSWDFQSSPQKHYWWWNHLKCKCMLHRHSVKGYQVAKLTLCSLGDSPSNFIHAH